MNRAAQQVWDKLAPVQTPDLQTYVEAIGGMFQEADDYASDSVTGQIGWSGLLDLSRAPDKGLDWLAQFIGVHFPASLSAADKRTRIQNTDGWKRGTVAAIAAAPKPFLTGSKTVIVRERFPDPYSFQVLTKRSETPVEDWDATNYITNGGFETNAATWTGPGARSIEKARFGTASLKWATAGGPNDSVQTGIGSGVVFPGETVTWSIYVNPDVTCSMNLQLNENNNVGGLNAFSEGPNVVCPAGVWTRLTHTKLLVAGTDNLGTYITTAGVQPISNIYVDGAQLEKNSQATPYIETNGAIASRPVGQGPVGTALREQKPAGLIMTYSLIDGNDYQSLVTNHALYSNVFADYATYQGVLNDAPGT